VEIVPGGFGYLEAVDMIVAVGDAWWYLLTAAERVDALLRLHRALRPQEVVVLEGPNFAEVTSGRCTATLEVELARSTLAP
jgi:uncharacterized ferritin-like protein (DUF455 family)